MSLQELFEQLQMGLIHCLALGDTEGLKEVQDELRQLVLAHPEVTPHPTLFLSTLTVIGTEG